MPTGLPALVFAGLLAAFAAADGALADPVSASAAADPSSWQCAQFARQFSGIQIFGDAWTWWDQAQGKYPRGVTPEAGSVLVFKPGGALSRGHVAVVGQVLTDRIIQVTHANWSPVEGRRGQIENSVTVVDVSPAGDWSQVKVWYEPSGALGSTVYPTYGFVYPTSAARVASAAEPRPDAFGPAARAALTAQINQALR